MNGYAKPRRPTTDEAVSHLTDSLTAVYQRECIRYWREKYGNDFAEAVRRGAWKRIGKRK